MRHIALFTLPLKLFAALSAICVYVEDLAAARPNILIILTDDLGYGDLRCYNPDHGKIATPNLDKFASEGMRFTDAHSSSAVCSPSRYSLLTGRYHWRTWLQSGIVDRYGPPLIAPDRLTIADMLHQQGYRTACIGKWHMGWNWPIPPGRREEFVADPRDTSDAPSEERRALWRDVFSQPISGGPLDCGFDSFFGVDLPNFPPFCYIDGNRTVGIPSDVLPADLLTNNLADFSRPAVPGWKLEPILPELAKRACEFIRTSAAQSQPFFLYLAVTSPHTPLAVNREWQGRSGLNAYADYVMETDAVVGEVLRTLDDAAIAENTLVVFTSDNGCAPYVGIEELAEHGHFPNWPYRGFKTDIWEGGHRVPFIVRWPGVVVAGGICTALVQQVDTMATIAGLLHIELPPNVGEDSFSYAPLLTGTEKTVRKTAVNQSIKGLFAVRRGPWKLVFGAGSGGWAKGTDTQRQQLYHVDNDPAEELNLVGKHPELVAELTSILTLIIANGRSTTGVVQHNDVLVKWDRFLTTSGP